jgi:hypothetical protein
MPILMRDTPAKQIHAHTKQELGPCTLPAGIEYQVIEPHTDAVGHKWLRISYKGLVYDIEDL